MEHRRKRKQLDLQGHMIKLRKRFDELDTIRHCRVCKTPVTDLSHKFCILCGSPILQTGRIPSMLYKAIRLTENGKAVVCPHCDNEELTPGEFCMICGRNIINRCADTPDKRNPQSNNVSCRTVLPGNARYCPKCGNESSFYQEGWLKDWRSENTKRAIENTKLATTVDLDEVKKERKQAQS